MREVRRVVGWCGKDGAVSNRRTGLLTGVVGMGDEVWCSVLTWVPYQRSTMPLRG